MNPSKICGHRATFIFTSLLWRELVSSAPRKMKARHRIQRPALFQASRKPTKSLRLKATLAEQQKQLQLLQQTLQNQQTLLEKALGSQTAAGNSAASSGNFNAIGQVASTSPMIPKVVAPLPVAYPAPAIAGPLPQAAGGGGGNPCEANEPTGPVPAYIRLGSVCIVPIGFMDFTPVLAR